MDYQKLNLLFRCNKEFSHERIRMQDISDTECMICSYVYSHEGCSQDDVATDLKTDKTTVGKALASLKKKNCVVRTQDKADKILSGVLSVGISASLANLLVSVSSMHRAASRAASRQESARVVKE